MPTLYRATVVLKHKSGVPKDNVSNTFHVEQAAVNGTPDAEAIAEIIRDFYVGVAPNTEFPLSTFIGSQIADVGHEVRMYPLDAPTGESVFYDGAPPEHVELFDFVGRNDETQGMASEVALCLSFRKVSSGAIPLARRTGRIFFGPIENVHITMEAGTSRPKPSDALRVTLGVNGQDLVDRLQAAGKSLVVYSRPFAGRFGAIKDNGDPKPDLPARAGTTHVVNQVFCDDAFDTQRRRGEKANVRLTLSA